MHSPNRWIIALFTVLLLTGCRLTAAADSGRVLVLARADDQAAMELLAAGNAPVHHQSQRYVIALVDAGRLDEPGLRSATILDRTPWEAGEAYYWAYNPGLKDARPKDAGKIEVLFRDGNTMLVRAAPLEAERLPLRGWEIARIQRAAAPLRTAVRDTAAQFPAPQFGGVIDQMVNAVDTATYAATLQSLVDFGTRYSYSDEILDAADWIHGRLTGFGLTVERDEFSISSYTRENIIATIPGQVHPDEVLFITAHYDSISNDPYNAAPGADDNGSGSSAVIEAARVLSQYAFERTIIFACFAGEEQGLYGSFAYTADVLATGMDVIGCINFDMIAYSGSDPAPPDLIIYTNTASLSLAGQFEDAALHYFPDDLEPVIINDSGMTASDHAAFWSRGYPAVFGCEAEPWTADFNPLYHTTNDLPDILDMDYAANVTRAGLAAVADLAVPLATGEARVVSGPGAGPDNPALVRVFPPEQDAAALAEWSAYGATGYGVNVAAGNLAGDPAEEILTGAGPGAIYGPHVRGFQADGTALPGLSFLAYGTNKYGVNVAAGDLDGDGMDEIITGAGPGAVFGPHVRAFSYDGSTTVTPLPEVSYFAYGTPKWGVNVACGDLDGDGRDEILTGAGPGSVYGPHVRGWSLAGGTVQAMTSLSFLAYGTNHFGVRVTCGDIDGDGMAELITGPGPSPQFAAHIRGWNYDGVALTELAGINFFAWPAEELLYGARVSATTDLDGDGLADLVVAAGPDPAAATPVRVYGFADGAPTLLFTLDAFDGGVTHGASVAAGRF
jgi:hypothetical protein